LTRPPGSSAARIRSGGSWCIIFHKYDIGVVGTTCGKPVHRYGLPDWCVPHGNAQWLVMTRYTTHFDEPHSDTPAAPRRILTIPAILDLKRGTWYYGARCVCARLLALCEDCFGGKGVEDLELRMRVAVNCECGARTSVTVLHKFKTP